MEAVNDLVDEKISRRNTFYAISTYFVPISQTCEVFSCNANRKSNPSIVVVVIVGDGGGHRKGLVDATTTMNSDTEESKGSANWSLS